MVSATHSNEKIHEALELLNAAAKERKEELAQLVSAKYGAVREALTGAAQGTSAWLREKGQAAGHAAKETAATVDEWVHKHPWPYIGGAALGALLLGYFLGRRK